MPSSIYFRGQNLYDPQVVIDINNQLLARDNLGAKHLCVVGKFPHLKPQELHVFRTDGGPSVAETYPNSRLMQNLDYVWKNSIRDSRQVSTSLSYVNACDPLTNVQASLQLLSRADNVATAANNEEYFGAATSALTLKNQDWGESGNNHSFQITPDFNEEDLTQIYSIIYRRPGGQAVAQTYGSGGVLSITSSVAGQIELGRDPTGRTITWTPDAGDAASIELDELEHLDELIDLINVIPGLTAEGLNYDYIPKDLDAFDYTWTAAALANTRETMFTQQYALNSEAIVGAHVKGLHDLINTLSSIRLTASIDSYDPNLETETYISSGGADGADPDADDYEAALAAIVDKDIQLITCLLADDDALRRAVAKKMVDHIEASLDASRDRQAILPCDEDTTIDDAHDLYVRPCTNPHISFVAQNVDWNIRTKFIQGDNSMMAFFVMCMQGALPYAEPLTRKAPNITQTRENWDRDNRFNKNKAIRKGLVIISQNLANELRINRGVTSWIKDNDTVNCEMSARESVLGCARFMRMRLEREIGGKILASTKGSLEFIVNARLKELVQISMIAAYNNISVEIVDDTAFVSFDIAPVNPLNFVKVTINIRQLQEILEG